MGELFSKRPCVAQIMSWTAGRITTRVKDRVYSLLGLLDANALMLVLGREESISPSSAGGHLC